MQVGKQVQNLMTCSHVDSRCWFVENQQLGLMKQSARHEHTLLLATRQLTNVAIVQASKTQLLQQLQGRFTFLFGDARPTTQHLASHHHHFKNRDGEIPIH